MRVEEFPNCCTALVLVGLGGTYTSGIQINDSDEAYPIRLEGFITRQINNMGGTAMLVATTNSQQVVANKILKKLGFEHSPWVSKKQHRETKLRLWYYRNKQL